MKSLEYHPVPCVELPLPEAKEQGLSLSVLREDLNHPFVSGNKWWKLKYNLEAAQRAGHRLLLTFGGAYSNHIYATAAAARELGLASVGIIRGEAVENATLRFAADCGMLLHFVPRAQYLEKANPDFLATLTARFGTGYVLPEGGTNALAIAACAEWARHLLKAHTFDFLCVPAGTGGTLAGLIAGLDGHSHVVGFAALRGGGFLNADVARWVERFSGRAYQNWHIETAFHYGGYGKRSPELLAAMNECEVTFGLPLDPVYTAKMLGGILALVRAHRFPHGSRILALHTGGLQGR